MFVPFLIMLREGIEAALIVGIVAGYLSQTGRHQWLPYVWIGILLALGFSLLTGAAIQYGNAEFPQKIQEIFEAVIGFVAVGVLTSMVLWMKKAARSMAKSLRVSIDEALAARSSANGLGLIALVFFAVAREGVESVFFLLAAFQQSHSAEAPTGALLGLLCSVGIGYGIYVGGLRLNLTRFFRWTGIFILAVAAGVLSSSMKSLHEAGIWNYAQAVVFDWSNTLPVGSPLGVFLSGIFGYQDTPTVSEITVYFAYLAATLYVFLCPSRKSDPVKDKIAQGQA
ncbi:iron uptake transporter permease EfeU [Candidimonas nitroreducens]|uniref:Iron transporter n=1 Tax=Candidimonas nitroreducens TaxID=683354 RepID=A0A225MYQ3_9BURK|nr:iron uptake transporter permease EfeU [Candidimonas nitroreducens]OWT66406.1 iron transporter [Candidimonas nitroreducens]